MMATWHAYRRDRANGRPPWWKWFEPPGWFPKWLHLHTCTFCRGMCRYVRQQQRREFG